MSMKGTARLASILQGRMAQMNDRGGSVSVEMGEVVEKGLKLDSLPGERVDEGEYLVNEDLELSLGDRVVVVWTYDGEPVVAFKVKGG